ncbi:Armadillo-type fold,Domain of unknown function DUF2428, death-receptor-like,Armadillo-like helical [Cinara cedri]|uniref:Uncharacterized protein n=1 Tax=Cinara cedri TaxID=506608 RepID=A0A5E4MSA6_9HEMI|nr:Armadillo-type fold,Domain of unknown function DUF2428, death-receptor-like,Armadillo-like helical [Cinara cedri]
MLPSQELLDKFSVEIFEKILQYDFTYLNDFNHFLQKIDLYGVDFCTKHLKYQDFCKNIHLKLIDIIVNGKQSSDYQNLVPQILYQTLYLSQQIIKVEQFNSTLVVENKWTFPIKTEDVTDNGTHIVHFISLGKKFKLPLEKYDQYCLQIHIGAIKCLQFEKKIDFVVDSIENICDLCFRHSKVNLEALKHLTECVSVITKKHWAICSTFIYKVLMGLMNHHLPPIHDQCILIFKKCLDLEDLNFILKTIMTEMSWSLRIKFYMLTVITSKYGVKKILEKYDILSISMWKCLNEPYLLSPCIDLYKVFIKNLSEDDYSTLVMQPIIHFLTTDNISELTRYNFVTYLLPEMKSKHSSSLFMLFKTLNNQSKLDLYLQVSVLRMIYNHNTEVNNFAEILDLSLKSGNTKIRSEAFSILCCSKITPNTLNSIYNFIVDNINSDCATLRIKLISSLELMLRKHKITNDLVLQFINRLYVFIIKNLAPGSNYQRKITSLKIYSIILRFNKNQDYISYSCRNLLFKNLLDSEDIRKKCSELLVSHFVIVKNDKPYLNNWMKLGLNLCYDPLFYKNESGSTIINTITTLIYKSGLTIDILDINTSSMSAHILNLAQKQCVKLTNNFVSNVTNGTLYGLLSTLNHLSFEKNSPESNMLNKIEIETMLNLIENNLNLMLDTLASRMDDEQKTEAPSFAQMDNALSSLIESTQDNVQIPTNQFLLNFIWINIKICCDSACKYAAMLAIKDVTDKQYQNSQIKRCANITADVLIRCRHKGAMEATCRSLGILIKHWNESQNWCENILTDHISCMKPENEISRRSAGVRYLIHAIVTNNKNTVENCIKQLFNIAKENICIGTDTVIDLPQARALHLLTAIVSNASISTDSIYPFMEDLIMLCIDKLNSPLWTIRNAALQFFSSLQVRLIGQNRLNNTSWLSHLPLEPLLYHFPHLVQRLQLLWSQTSHQISSQTRLIPFMSLLKGVKLQSWTLLPPEYQEILKSLRYDMWSIGFALEIYTVRNMAAQAYANTIQVNKLSSTLNKISNEIIKYERGIDFPEFKGFNHLHGLMSVYRYLKDVYFMEFNQQYAVFNIVHENLPPLCKSIYISLNHKVLGPIPSNSTIDHNHVKHLIIENNIIQSSNLLILMEYYMSTDKHTTLSFLKCFRNCNKSNKNVLINRFVNFLDTNDLDIFKEIMVNIDALVNRSFEDDIIIKIDNDYFSAILNKCVSCSEKEVIAMLPVLSWLCPSEAQNILLPLICKYIDCNVYDSSDRFRSSKSLYYFTNLKNDIRLWNTVIELLQDEDTDVRVEITRFVNRICYNCSSTLNPYMCLRKMFEIDTVCLIVNSKLAFTCFWDLLLSDIKLKTEIDEIINPFFNEQSNVYQEQSNIMKLAYEGLKYLIHLNDNINFYRELVEKCLNTLINECQFKGTFIDLDLMILDMYSSLYFLKLYYKREILVLLNLKKHLHIFLPILELMYLPKEIQSLTI